MKVKKERALQSFAALWRFGVMCGWVGRGVVGVIRCWVGRVVVGVIRFRLFRIIRPWLLQLLKFSGCRYSSFQSMFICSPLLCYYCYCFYYE